MGLRKVLLLVLALMMLPAASAFTVSFTNVNNSVFPDQTASYAMTLVNDKGFENSFQVSTRDPNWVLSTEPSLSAIPPESTRSHMLKIKPKQGLDLGPHAVPIKVRSLTSGQFQEHNLLVNIKPKTPFGGEYAPAVRLRAYMNTTVDPREKVTVTLEMSNRNPRDMPNVTAIVDGKIFYKKFQMHINPLEEKSREFIFRPDPLVSPGIYTLDVRLMLGNITIANVAKEFEVIKYTGKNEEVNKSTNFFKITKNIHVRNDANVEREIKKRMQIGFFQDIFTSFEPEPEEVRVGGETYYQWSAETGPQETLIITMVENYRIPVMALIAAVIALIAYFLFRSPVVVSKTAYTEKMEDEKTIIKVTLEVRNRSKETVKNVTILDKIPSMADYVKKTEPGTLAPEKVVKSSSKGTSCRWELDRLEAHEERIITYRVKCKLQIVGGMSLPPSKVKFETPDGKERSSLSNKVSVQETA